MKNFNFLFSTLLLLFISNLSLKAQCFGPPNAGDVTPASITQCASNPLNLTLQNQDISPGIIFYQWQVSLDGGSTFANISGETSTTLVDSSLTVGSYVYRCAVICSNTNDSSFSLISGVDITPGIDITIAALNDETNGSCDGNIDINVSGGDGNYNFAWSNSQTSEDISLICSGNYTVTVSDLSACSNSKTFTVSNFIPSCSGLPNAGDVTPSSLTQCASNPLTLSLQNNDSFSGIVYQWQVSLDGGSTFANISGETSTTLVDSSLTVGSYVYRCAVICSNTNDSSFSLISGVDITPGIDITIAALNDETNGSCDGNIDINVSGGDGNYNFAWSNSQTSEDISLICSGNYTVTVSDLSACSNSKTFTISNILPGCSGIPNAGSIAQSNLSVCDSSIVNLNLTNHDTLSGITYQWQLSTDSGLTYSNISGAINDTLLTNPLTQGFYTYRCKLTCTNSGDSSFSTLSSVSVRAKINISLNNLVNVNCSGNCNGSINVDVTGGDGTYSYLWNTNVISQDLTNLCPGSYSLLVNDTSGCSSTSSIFNITEPTVLNTSVNGGSICNGDTLTLNAIVTGGTSPYTISWTPSLNLSVSSGPQVDAFPATTTTYSATVLDFNGCISISNVSVNVNPLPLISVTSLSGGVIQAGNTDTLIATGGVSYLWLDTVLNSSTIDTVTITPLTTTTYTVSGVDSNGCSSTANVTVTFNSMVLTTNSVDASCFGGSNGAIDLTVSGGNPPYTYSWSNADTTEDLSGITAGTYFVTVVDANFDTVTTTATVLEPNQINISLGSQINTLCGSSTGEISVNVLGGVLPYTLSWSNGQNGLSIDSLVAGNYNLTVIDSNACSTNKTFTITNQFSNSQIHGTVQLQGNFVTSGTAYLYQITDTTSYLLKDSAQLNNFGEFDFSVSYSSQFIIGVKPNPSTYPNALTSFYGNVYRWSDADTLNTSCGSADTIGINISSLSLSTGTGFISGVVLDVTDTTDQRRPGEPIRGIDIILEDVPGGNSVSKRTVTDANGEYIFSNVANGNYRLFVQIPGCELINTYQLSITGSKNYVNKDFFVDSLDGFIDTTLQISIQVCSFNTNFSANTVCIGDTTLFNDLSLSVPTAVTSYRWDFNGDGVTDDTTKGRTSFVYTTAGTFNARLILRTYDGVCSDTATVSVIVNDLPRVTAGPDTSICTGNTITIVAGGATSYTWNSDPLITNLFNDTIVLNATNAFIKNFIVIGKDANGCSNRDTASVSSNLTPNAIFLIEENNICLGNLAEFRDSSLSVANGSSYHWDFDNDGIADDTTNGNTSFSFSDDGTYTVELLIESPNGCKDSISKNITIRPNTIDVSAGFDRSLICGANTTLAAFSNTTGVSYLWTPNYYLNNPFISNPVATPDTTTSYIVKATKNGCSDYDTIIVNVTPLTVDAGIDKTIICSNSTNLIGTSNGVSGTLYQWTPGDGLSTQNKINPVASPVQTTTYVLTAFRNTCIATDTVTVTVNPISISAGSDKSIVCGQSTTISATSPGATGLTWSWSPPIGIANPSISNTTAAPSVTTTYLLTGTKGNCVSKDTLLVSVSPFNLSAGNDKTIDCGTSTSLQGSSFYTSGTAYNWTPNTGLSNSLALTTTASPETTTIYTLTAIKGNCVSSDTVKVNVNQSIPISFTADKTIFNSKFPPYTVKFTNNTPNSTGYVFTWNFGDSTALITAKNYTYSYQKAGIFTVSLYAQNLSGGCKDTLTYNDYIVAWTPTAIPNMLSENHDVEIYPNPGNGIATIDLSNSEIKDGLISITNLNGQDVYRSMIEINSRKQSIDLSNLESGVYFIKIENETSVIVKRYVKE